jgi:hypothetical protein
VAETTDKSLATIEKTTDNATEDSMTEKSAPIAEANQDGVSTDRTEDIKPEGEQAQDGQEGEEKEYPKGLPLVLIITSLCLAVFLVALDQTIIAPALGAITAEYKSVKDIVSQLLCLAVSEGVVLTNAPGLV